MTCGNVCFEAVANDLLVAGARVVVAYSAFEAEAILSGLRPFKVQQVRFEGEAHVVLGHHSHILRGIEMHRGRPIFHGLGNGVVVTRALSPAQDHPARAAWALKRRELFGFEPDPDYPLYPFHPEAKNVIVGEIDVASDGTCLAAFRTFWVEPSGRPIPAPRGAGGEAVAEYVARISAGAGFVTRFEWAGERVVCA